MKNFVDVEDRLPILKTIPLSLQHLFAMVGATILVPKLLNMEPSIALLGSGIGTLIYIICTKAKTCTWYLWCKNKLYNKFCS